MKKTHAVALVLYGFVVVAVFGKALFPRAGQMIFGDDIHHQYYFYRDFFNSSLRHGIFPWWNPYMFGGVPFIANPVVNIWYPPNWLFFFLPLNIAYSWHPALHILWAMTGMFVLLRAVHNSPSPPLTLRGGRGELLMVWVPPWVGGLIFGLSGFFMARTYAGHVDVIAAASWMPWVVWAFFYSSSIPKAALVFAMQLFAGYQTMAFFTVEVVGLALGVEALAIRSIRHMGRALTAGLLGIGLAGLELIPVQEFFRLSIRTFSFPYSWISYGSMGVESLRQLLNPFFFGNQLTYRGPAPNFIEHSMFIGIGGLALAMVGLVYILRRPSKRVMGLACILIVLWGLWVSLGPNAPVDLQKILWRIVPMYRYLRIPPRHLILVVFGLSGLAAIGLSRIRNGMVQMVIVAFVLVEMIQFGRTFIAIKDVPEARHDRLLIATLTKDTKPNRVLLNFGVWLPQRDTLDFDSVLSYGIYSSTGYDPSILRSYFEFISEASGISGERAVLSHDVQIPYLTPAWADTIDFLNIKYVMVPRAYDPFLGNARYTLLREDARGDFRLYENTTVKPRFFFGDIKEGRVNIIKYSPNEIVLSTDNEGAAMLSSSEVYYPGWEGFIDGKKQDILKSNHAFRSIFVPAGKHTVLYRYSPRIFLIGGLVTVLTAFVCIGIIFKKQ